MKNSKSWVTDPATLYSSSKPDGEFSRCIHPDEFVKMHAYPLQAPLDIFDDLTVSIEVFLEANGSKLHNQTKGGSYCWDTCSMSVHLSVLHMRTIQVASAYKTFEGIGYKYMSLGDGFYVNVAYNPFSEFKPIFIFKAYNNGTTMLISEASLKHCKLPMLDQNFK